MWTFNHLINLKYLKRKKELEGKKLITHVLNAVMLCAILDVIVKNILFKNDSTNIFHVFNLTSAFLYFKKNIIDSSAIQYANNYIII